MAITNLGPIAVVYKGDWASGTYKKLNSVRHNKAVWWCIAPTTTEEPGAGTDWILAVMDGYDSTMNIAWHQKISNVLAEVGLWYLMDSTGGSLAVTLPASPSAGESVYVCSGPAADSNPIELVGNGNTINDDTESFYLEAVNGMYFLVFDGNTWLVVGGGGISEEGLNEWFDLGTRLVKPVEAQDPNNDNPYQWSPQRVKQTFDYWIAEKGGYAKAVYDQANDKWDHTDAKIGPTLMHESLRRCMVDPSTATVNYYLNKYDSNYKENGVTPADFTGADGICMVEVGTPAYVRMAWDGDVVTFEMRPSAAPGFTLHPSFETCNKWYIGAFAAGVMQSDGTLRNGNDQNNNSSAINSITDTLVSLPSGKPYCGLTRAEFRTLARNNNAQLMDYWQWNYLQWLMLTEFGTWDMQSAVGLGLVGYASWPSGGAANNGLSLSIGNMSGGFSTPAGNNLTDFVSYRGVENLWGNYFQFMDGFNANDRQVYLCNDPTKYADDTTSNYSSVGSAMPSSGWIKSIQKLGPEIIPATAGGSSDEYMTDSLYTNTEHCAARVGGHAFRGLHAGAFCLDASIDAGYRDLSFSSRVSLRGSN